MFSDGHLRLAWPGLTFVHAQPTWIRYSDFPVDPPLIAELTAAGLLATIAVAFTVHAVLHQFRADLLLDAAAVAFLAVHGPVCRELLSRLRRAAN